MGEGNAEIDYSAWSNHDLIRRVTELEAKLKDQNTTYLSATQPNGTPPPPALPDQTIVNGETKSSPYRKLPKTSPKPFQPSKYTTRLIALKFAYLGQGYNGFEHHANNSTPLPTIEEEIWKALVKTRLIFPLAKGEPGPGATNAGAGKPGAMWEREEVDVNWEGCEYSKCGRTDRGVSAFGQVIGVRVRSNRRAKPISNVYSHDPANEEDQTGNLEAGGTEDIFDPIADELPYIQLLNRVLPPTIRILAWCPNPPPNFSARFACKERRYKYFFTNPCFAPVPGAPGLYPTTTPEEAGRAEDSVMREGWLDIEKMREGCRRLVGLHDFRNFCKQDASKQITNFQRRIFHADIEEISPLSLPSFVSSSSFLPPSTLLPPSLTDQYAPQSTIYAITIHGSAFLWHQVRSIAAILFLIGQGLESPFLIPSLLDVSSNPQKPKYEMATDAPLVLWDCIFPAEAEVQDSEIREKGYEDSLEWVYVGEKGGIEGGNVKEKGKWGRGGNIDDVWEIWRAHKIQETLSAQLLDVVAGSGRGLTASGASADADVEEVGTKLGGKKKGRAIGAGARLFDGGDVPKLKGNYIPVLKKERMEPVEVVNEKYARRKGWDPANPKLRNQDADE